MNKNTEFLKQQTNKVFVNIKTKMNFQKSTIVFVLTFATLTVLSVADEPVLKSASIKAHPNKYNPNNRFTLKCSVQIIPNTVKYSVSFRQNKTSIAWYYMNGKRYLQFINRLIF